MNTKPLIAIGIATTSGSAFAGNMLDYQITVGPNDSLTDAYIIEYDATESFVSIAPVNTENPGAVFPAGTVLNGVMDIGTTPLTDAISLNVVGAFTDTTGTNVAMSFPTPLANALIGANATWAQINTAYFFGQMPSESSALADVQSQNTAEVYNIGAFFDYLPVTSPVLQPAGTPGTIVDFDGATYGGSFSYHPAATPEPASLAVLGLGVLAIVRRRRRAK